MKEKFSKETRSDLNKLGIYQVAGGSVGLAIIWYGIFRQQELTTGIILLYCFITLLFGYSILSGIMCLKIKNNALKLSMINQLLQVIGFSMFGYAYGFAAGFYLNIGLDFTNTFQLNFGVGISNIILTLNSDAIESSVSLNLVALAIIIWIERLISKTKRIKELDDISTIGEAPVSQYTDN